MTRGWPYERKPIKAFDSAGKQIEVSVGLTRDAEGHLRMALAVGDVRDPEHSGPTAMLGFDDGTGPELIKLLRLTLADLIKHGGA